MPDFTRILCVSQKDLDELNHVNNIRYLEWVQEISKAHWQKATEDVEVGEYLWVVKKHTIMYHQSAVLNDEIKISTRVLEWRGPVSTRFVEIKNNKSQQLLVSATTEWCLLKAETWKPARAPEHIKKLFL
ncbi:MAG: thioesterase family protein [Bacteroidota bacterium]